MSRSLRRPARGLPRAPGLVSLLACLCGAGCASPPGPVPTTLTTAPAPAATAPDATQALRRCCEQCLRAAGRDPAGYDLRIIACTKYRGEWNGQVGVDDACAERFAAAGTTVGWCQGREGRLDASP